MARVTAVVMVHRWCIVGILQGWNQKETESETDMRRRGSHSHAHDHDNDQQGERS